MKNFDTDHGSPASVRAMCLRQSEDSFYLAVKEPFHAATRQYKKLRELAHCAIYNLEDGTQVFAYSREEFSAGNRNIKFSDADRFSKAVISTARELKSPLVIDPRVEDASQQIQPFSQDGEDTPDFITIP